MAIYKERFNKQGSNAAQIDAAHDWATAFKVRMSELEEARYGACNKLRLVNNSAADLTVSFTWDVQRTNSFLVKGNSVFNMNVDDGQSFYGFDVYSADAAIDVAIGEVKYSMARVEQVRE